MDDLRSLLGRTASDLEPDGGGWSRVVDRRRRHQRTRQVTAGAVALVVAAGGLTLAALEIHPSAESAGPPVGSNAPSPTQPNHVMTVTVHAEGYPATCTATVANSNVAPGDAVSIAFVVRNGGDETLQVPYDYGGSYGRLRIRDASGRLLFDTETLHAGERGPYVAPTPLRPAHSLTKATDSTVVRWAGPITLAGSCPTSYRSVSGRDLPVRFPRLPNFRLAVLPQGPTPSEADAIDRAVAATGGLYGSCHPGSHGELVAGLLRPPEVPGDEPKAQPQPLSATCWADTDRGPGFADVTMFFSSPPTRSVLPTSGPLGLPSPGPEGPAEVGRWEVLVLPASAATVEYPTSAGTSGPEGDVGYDFDPVRGGWELGDLSCLGGGFVGGTVHFFPPSGHHACNPHG